MTDPEREHFAHQVHDLERRLRRWQLIAFVLAALLLVPIVGGGLLAFVGVRWTQVERERAAVLEDRARAAEEAEARRQAEKARQEAEKKLADKDKAAGRD